MASASPAQRVTTKAESHSTTASGVFSRWWRRRSSLSRSAASARLLSVMSVCIARLATCRPCSSWIGEALYRVQSSEPSLRRAFHSPLTTSPARRPALACSTAGSESSHVKSGPALPRSSSTE